jgi:coatomer subunit beta
MASAEKLASGSNMCFTLVAEDPEALATSQDLRAALEKGTDELKLETLRRIIISTLNGQPHVGFQLGVKGRRGSE